MSGREPRIFAVYGFATTHDALAAESVVKAAGIAVIPVPAPRALGSLCGVALRVPLDEAEAAEAAVLAARAAWVSRIEMEDV